MIDDGDSPLNQADPKAGRLELPWRLAKQGQPMIVLAAA
jgi:hypothetical protein